MRSEVRSWRCWPRGKVTVEQAERPIDALERELPKSVPGGAPRPKYLRVVINSEESAGSDGASRINVRVPLQLLRAGARLTSFIPPQALSRANAELHKSGVPIDLTELKPQDLEDLIEQLDDLTVDIDDSDCNVQVFRE